MLCWLEVVRNVFVCFVGVVFVYVVMEFYELIFGDFDGFFEDGLYDVFGVWGCC